MYYLLQHQHLYSLSYFLDMASQSSPKTPRRSDRIVTQLGSSQPRKGLIPSYLYNEITTNGVLGSITFEDLLNRDNQSR
jgi:hypothetical protein